VVAPSCGAQGLKTPRDLCNMPLRRRRLPPPFPCHTPALTSSYVMYGTPPPPEWSSPSILGMTGEAPVAITTPSVAVKVTDVPSGCRMES
jgi:hypothetical protein